MKIAFDHQAFTLQKFGGVSRYLTQLATELDNLGQEVRIFAGIYQNQYLPKIDPSLVSGRHIKKYPKKTGTIIDYLNHFWTQGQIKSYAPDIIHETYYSFAYQAKVKAARVVTVHDMIHEIFPDSFKKNDPLTNYKRSACERADHIISVSQNTKNDLINKFQIAPEKISVIHLAVNSLNSLSIPSEIISPKPFILYVGARYEYKNFKLLVKALGTSPDLKNNFDLVVFGGGNFDEKELSLFSSLGLSTSQVRYVEGSDDTLVSLYRTASAFVYPSIYEGFGLPPLEAMLHDCPVISSNTSSMPEVIGDAAEFFNPNSLDELTFALERVLFSENRKTELIQKGRKRVAEFSWKKCAVQTLAIYQKVKL